jgi:Tfp pilus assembly protein PilF
MSRFRSVSLAVALSILLAGCHSAGTRHDSARTAPPKLDAIEGLKGDTGVVRTEFRKELEPAEAFSAQLDVARAQEAQGNLEAAVALYQKALEAPAGHKQRGRAPASQRALAHRRMAADLDRLGRFAQAETHYREALKLAPNDPKVWNDAGYSYYLQGRWEESLRSLRTAARLAPDDARIQTNLGLCLAASGKTDEALEALTRAGGPAVGEANLAFILAAAGKRAEARTHYEAALRIQPDLEPARAALAQLDRDANRGNAPVLAEAPTSDRRVARTSTTAR